LKFYKTEDKGFESLILFKDKLLTTKKYNRIIAINMGLSKTEIFTRQQNQMAGYAKALAHPARIAILQELLKVNTCICGDLVNEVGLAQSTVSQHLKELKKAGLIQGTIEGTSVCYCISPEHWKSMKDMLLNLLDNDTDLKTDCC